VTRLLVASALVAVVGLAFFYCAGRQNQASDEVSEAEVRRILDEDWDRAVARLLDEPWEGK
jgi:nitrogen fixation-related uncharacterized protein